MSSDYTSNKLSDDPYVDCSQKPIQDSSIDIHDSSRDMMEDSVIIEEPPEVAKKNVSVIELGDSLDSSSLKLELSDTQASHNNGKSRSPNVSNSGLRILNTSPMSELLAPNSLLYQDA